MALALIFERGQAGYPFKMGEEVRAIIETTLKTDRFGRNVLVFYKQSLGVANPNFNQEIVKCLFGCHLKIAAKRRNAQIRD